MSISALVYHSAVRRVRKQNNNTFIAIKVNMLKVATFVAIFYFMFIILGLRSAAIRGDFLVYIMSGIFLFMTHTKTMQGVFASEGPSSTVMQHAPINTGYNWQYRFSIWNDHSCLGFRSSDRLSIAGFKILVPHGSYPDVYAIYESKHDRFRQNVRANTLPYFMLAMFDWNPLFHLIDQERGFAFINYFPRNSN